MFLAELTGTFDDIIGSALSPSIDMACGKLLTETDGSARIHDINHIVARSEQLGGIRIVHCLFGRCGSSVIVHDERIFLIGIELRRQTVVTGNFRTVGSLEIPVLDGSHIHLLQFLGVWIGNQSGFTL